MDETTAVMLALAGYVVAIGLMLAIAVYLSRTQPIGGRIPTVVIVALILLGPLGLVGFLILAFRFRQGRLLAERLPPPPP